MLNFWRQRRGIFKTFPDIQDGGFCKISTQFLVFSYFCKNSILDVWRDSEFAYEASNDLRKKLYLSCLTGF